MAYEAAPASSKNKFDIYRRRAGQDAAKAKTEAGGALQRRFAAQGMLNSGEAIKSEQLAGEKVDEASAKAMENIDIAQAGEEEQKAQIEAERAYRTSEREAGQQFGREERIGSQQFATGEREAGQSFQALEASKQRGFSRELFDIEQGFKEKQQAFAESSWSDDFNERRKQFRSTEALEREAFDFNRDVAKGKYDKPSLMEKLVNPVGALAGPSAKKYKVDKSGQNPY